MEKKNKSRFYSLLIFSLVFLLNPNINVIDIMPDFIAWFILAKLFESAADSAPYFEEARLGFVKLGYVNLAKIIGLLIIFFVKSRDVSDNNIFALVSLSFAAIELLFLIPTVKNIFLALFHLGERTDALALISPINSTEKNQTGGFLHCVFSAESVKECTYFFFIAKSVLYVLPDMFLLTRSTDKGYYVNVSRAYPIVLLLSLALGITVGVLWFVRVKRYALSVAREGKFHSALLSMRSKDSFGKYEVKQKLRSATAFLTLVSVSSLFTLEFAFDNWSGINILPHFIYILLMLVAVFYSKKHASRQMPCIIAGACAFIASAVDYLLLISFLSRFSYEDIGFDAQARSAYLLIEIFAIIEFVSVVAFLFFFMRIMNSFVLKNTGLSPDSERYSPTERAFHTSVMNKNLVIFIFGILAAMAKCANVFINSSSQIIFTDESDVTAGAFYASIAPWFNLVITVTAVLYIFFTFYYVSNLKDEVKMKYST